MYNKLASSVCGIFAGITLMITATLWMFSMDGWQLTGLTTAAVLLYSVQFAILSQGD